MMVMTTMVVVATVVVWLSPELLACSKPKLASVIRHLGNFGLSLGSFSIIELFKAKT